MSLSETVKLNFIENKFPKTEKVDINVLSCEGCNHLTECIKQFGSYREDGDDYRAVIGTHFCRASWDNFKCCNCKGK